MPTPTDSAPLTEPQVTLRYWAGARAAAGVEHESRAGATVGAVLDAAVDAHPGLRAVIPVSSILLEGRPAGRDVVVPDGAVLEVLPPFAGG
jgi:sulfur-carrier protein